MLQQHQRSLRLQRRFSRKESVCGPFHDRDDRGWAPIHVASRKGDLDEVRRLLDGGADVNVRTSGHKGLGTTPLHLAAAGGFLEVMDELLERGANIEARTKGGCGWTPLHNAAKENNKKAILFLINNGAFLPPDINDRRFNPPAHYCPGLEWAYKAREKSLLKLASGNSGGGIDSDYDAESSQKS